MVFKRYIKRGNKVLGPYYYESYRDKDGKVHKRYLGTEDPNKKTKKKNTQRSNGSDVIPENELFPVPSSVSSHKRLSRFQIEKIRTHIHTVRLTGVVKQKDIDGLVKRLKRSAPRKGDYGVKFRSKFAEFFNRCSEFPFDKTRVMLYHDPKED